MGREMFGIVLLILALLLILIGVFIVAWYWKDVKFDLKGFFPSLNSKKDYMFLAGLRTILMGLLLVVLALICIWGGF